MTCEELDALVDDLAFGLLSPAQDRSARQHAADCPRCAGELMVAEELALRVRQLPKTQLPESDLWREIVPALRASTQGQRFHPSWMTLAAASLVAFTLGVGLRWMPQGEEPRTAASISDDRVAEAAAWASIAYRDDHFLHVREDLLAAVEARRDRLPPDTFEIVEENLRLLDEAVRSLRRALAEMPDDPDLPLQIASAYRQQARVTRHLERTILSI